MAFETVDFSSFALSNFTLKGFSILCYYLICTFFTDKLNVPKRAKIILRFLTIVVFVITMYVLNAF